MGLALHKTVGEIRAMPYAEFKSWIYFYKIEPFGFENDEYRTAAILAMLYNINRGKGKTKNVNDFMRDVARDVSAEMKSKNAFSELSREEQIRKIKQDFGIK